MYVFWTGDDGPSIAKRSTAQERGNWDFERDGGLGSRYAQPLAGHGSRDSMVQNVFPDELKKRITSNT